MLSPSEKRLLDLWADLRARLPGLEVRRAGHGWRLRSGEREGRLGAGDVGAFDAAERAERRREGRSYVDLGTGEVFVDGPGLLLLARVAAARSGLTPMQCALVAALLEGDSVEWFEAALAEGSGALRAAWGRELGFDIAGSVASKFAAGLETEGIWDGRRLRMREALEAVLDGFRLDAVGKGVRVSAPAESVRGWLVEEAGDRRVVGGVAAVLADEAGTALEPQDFLVEPSLAAELVRRLGGELPRDARGPSVALRPARRVPLSALAPRSDRLSELLAIAEALRGESPVAREAAESLAAAWRSRCE